MTRTAASPRRQTASILGGPYEIREEIGAGRTARIFSAVDISDPWGRPLAVKALRSPLADDMRRVASLEREAKVMASLAHPNIAEVVDYGYQAGAFIIVMEYIHGVSLQRLMKTMEQRRTQVPEPIVFYLALEVLQALDYIHRRRLVHGGVAPGNVLVDHRGRIKLIDFGAAHKVDSPDTAVRHLSGDLGYLSPEQARGDRTDQRSDLFSVGILLAELALQCRLFTGPDPADVLDQALRADLSTLQRVGSRLPFGLEFVLSLGLDADPERRFQSARELSEALHELLKVQGASIPCARDVASWLKANQIIEPVSGVRSIMLPGWLRTPADRPLA